MRVTVLVEASALRAPVGIRRSRTSVGSPLLRLRSDEQLVALFRAGHDEAFRVIHDRYRQRLFAYTRQMLRGSRQDAEDALQDVFVRAYSGLRASDRRLALRAWLYRVAHNRCIDELRRPPCSPPEVLELVSSPTHDPFEETERREALRRLVADVRRLPEQQRSALLLRELSGMSYAELSAALGVSVAAVKSLLVRARCGLVQAAQARELTCEQIREQLILAHEEEARPNVTARRHIRDCAGCRAFRKEIKGASRQLAALTPTFAPLALLAKVLGIGATGNGGVAAGGTGGVALAGGACATGAGHVATLLAAAVITAGGAVEMHAFAPAHGHLIHHQHAASSTVALAEQRSLAGSVGAGGGVLRGGSSASSGSTAGQSRQAASHTKHPTSTSATHTIAAAGGTTTTGQPSAAPGGSGSPSGGSTSTTGGVHGTGVTGSGSGSTPSSSSSGTTSPISTLGTSPAGGSSAGAGSSGSGSPGGTSPSGSGSPGSTGAAPSGGKPSGGKP